MHKQLNDTQTDRQTDGRMDGWMDSKSTDLGVDSVGRQEDGGLGRTVNLLLQDPPLYLRRRQI